MAPNLPSDPDLQFQEMLLELARGSTHDTQLDDPLLQVGFSLAHYRILSVLGRGGMGTVFLAQDSKLLRKVALKVVHPRRASDSDEAVIQEARAAAAVVHPNVAAIFDVQKHDHLSFIVMEYIQGSSLRSRIPKQGMAWKDAWNLAVQIASGLQAAHQLGIIHRDLKPDNIMVNDSGVAKILDFGLAKSISEFQAGDVSKVAGTPGYMAPELPKTRLYNKGTDIFAFGVLFHELLSGRRPSLSQPLDRGPRSLRKLIQKCLSENPSDRPADASDLLVCLQAASPSRRLRIQLGILAASSCLALAAFFAFRPAARSTSLLEQLTFNSAEAPVSQSALSPDASLLAYIDTRGLVLLNMKTRQERQLLEPAIVDQFSCLAWFSDSKRILFRSREAANQSQLLIVELDSGKTSKLGRPDTWLCAAPSPDNTRVAYSRFLPSGAEIGSFPLSHPDTLLPLYSAHKDERLFSHVAWSPDSALIAFGSYSGRFEVKDSVLSLADWRLSQIKTVVSESSLYQQSYTAAFAWSGKRELVFALAPKKNFDNNQELRLLKLPPDPFSPSENHPYPHSFLANADGSVIGSLSSDKSSKRLTYIRYAKQSDIWIGTLPKSPGPLSDLRRLTLSERNEWPSDWSDDSSTILAVVEGNSSFTASYVQVNSGLVSPIYPSDAFTTWPVIAWNSSVFWSISSDKNAAQASLFLYHQPPPKQIYSAQIPIVDASGRPPPRENWLRCALDAKRCFLLHQLPGGGLVLDELSSEGQTKRLSGTIDVPWARGFAVSPDGTKVAIADQSRRQVLILGTSGEILKTLKPELGAVQFVTWTPDGAGLIVSAMGGPKLFTLELWTDSSRAVLWQNDWAWLTHPVVSPDGTQLAFAATPFHGNLWSIQP